MSQTLVQDVQDAQGLAAAREAVVMRKPIRWQVYLYILPVMLFMLTFVYYPITYTVGVSTLDWNGIGAARTPIGLQNYESALVDPIATRALGNQLRFGLITVAFGMAIGLTMAILLKAQVRLKNLYKLLFFFPVVISATVTSYIFRRIYDGNAGELNALLNALGLSSLTNAWLADPTLALYSLMIAALWQGTGFGFMLYYAALTQIDDEIYEAARIDGAGLFQIIRFITLPLLRNTHFTLVILSVISVLKTFDLVWLITQGNPAHTTEFMSTYIFKKGILEFKAGYASSLAIVLLIIAFVLTVIQLRTYYQNQRGV